ncbi:rhomboid family intramembrane serine protease [Candidatus Micrarchaeota archaeon]|nr:rhomboid family intramembrane serine protease [Candidatus Micrarchaeota archaeon]
MFFKKTPFGTIFLAIFILVAYWLLAADTPYITDENLGDYALTPNHPLSIISHLFIHVGIFHLVGNLLPLLFFGLALEAVLISADVVLIFFLAGTGASLIFAITNPGVPLIGASGGISGIISALLLLRPKVSIALLLATPLLISFVFYPAADFASNAYANSLEEKKIAVQEDLQTAIEENRPIEEIAKLNQTVLVTEEKIDITFQGKEREAATPTDFFVHVYGAIFGGVYLYLFKIKLLKRSEKEYLKLGEEIFEKIDQIKERLRI